MRRFLPVILVAALATPGCTALGLPGFLGGNVTNNSNLTTVAPLNTADTALKTREGLHSLNAALASLRDLKGSSAIAPKGTAADLQQAAAGYRTQTADNDADDFLPNAAYSRIQWFHEVVSTPSLATEPNDYVLTETFTEEGRIDGVPVEHYETTVTTRIPRANGYVPTTGTDGVADSGDYVTDWEALGGTYTRDERVTHSEFRKLGRYVITGTMTHTNGKPLLQATQDFTPLGATTPYRLTFSTTTVDNAMTFDVKGVDPDGGTLDLKSTAAFTVNGTASTGTFAQQGSIVTAKGQTILIDTALNLSSDGTSVTAAGNLSLDFKGQLVLKMALNQTASGDTSTGAIFAADGTTQMGTIAVSGANPVGTVTFKDGSTQTLNMQTISDLMNVAIIDI